MHSLLQKLKKLLKRITVFVSTRSKQVWQHKKLRLPLIILAALVLIMLGNSINTQSQLSNNQEKATTKTRTQPGDLTRGTPEFTTLLPEGKSIDDFGGWTRVSPQDSAPTFAFKDMVDSTPIIVSQQELPEDLSGNNIDQLSLLAEGYHADHVIKAGSTTVHIGTSSKGPQSVIFGKNKLLVLIKSSAVISDEQWQRYISSLN